MGAKETIQIDGREFSELCPHFRAAPHQRLDDLRRRTGIAWDASQAQYLMLRHDEVRAMLQDRSLLRGRERANPQSAVGKTYEAPPEDIVERRNGAQVLIFKDGEDHQRLRRLIGAAFIARVRTARDMVERIAREAAAALPDGEFDLVNAYAIPIPVRVIATLLGLPEADFARVRAWSDDLALGFNPYRTPEEDQRRWQAIREMLAYFKRRLALAHEQKGEDLISDWAALNEAGEPLSEAEIVDHCIMMLTAGNLSTTDMIANAALALLRDSEARALIRREPERIGAVIEESLRIDPPVTITDRIAPADIEVSGCPVRKGDVMTASLLAANHDPDTFADPHRFDAARPPHPHLAFGAGAHICVGAPLARIEGQAAIRALFARFPDLALVEENVNLRPVPGHLGPEQLIVRG